MSERSDLSPPEHLSDRAKAIWSAVVPARCKSAERCFLLQAALEAFDRATEAREIVARDGMTTETKTTGAVHGHPMLKIERESRQQFAKIWSTLSLHFSPAIDGRRDY